LVSDIKGRRRLRMVERRVVWRTFGSRRYVVTGGWRRLHTEKLHNIYF
jgi:hypothetical protein